MCSQRILNISSRNRAFVIDAISRSHYCFSHKTSALSLAGRGASPSYMYTATPPFFAILFRPYDVYFYYCLYFFRLRHFLDDFSRFVAAHSNAQRFTFSASGRHIFSEHSRMTWWADMTLAMMRIYFSRRFLPRILSTLIFSIFLMPMPLLLSWEYWWRAKLACGQSIPHG